ncbi:hypothetical protein NC652_010256 [Populus alba x Populus x berolinensis]|nr:hypothetical protein NC652_010256 [Populus alba x Populus x berolinensis]
MQDELLWGAVWLHKASRRRRYREYTVKKEVILHAGDTMDEFCWDNKHAGINVLISESGAVPLFNLADACAKRLGLCPYHTLSHFISSTSTFPENESDNSVSWTLNW